MKNPLMASLMAGVLCAMTAPADAHHSFAMFDMTKVVTIAGSVKSFQWTNPHVWIEIDVPDAGGRSSLWRIEGGGVSTLKRQGWTGVSFTPGMKVEMTVNPLRNGEPGGSFVHAKFADGRELGKLPTAGN